MKFTEPHPLSSTMANRYINHFEGKCTGSGDAGCYGKVKEGSEDKFKFTNHDQQIIQDTTSTSRDHKICRLRVPFTDVNRGHSISRACEMLLTEKLNNVLQILHQKLHGKHHQKRRNILYLSSKKVKYQYYLQKPIFTM